MSRLVTPLGASVGTSLVVTWNSILSYTWFFAQLRTLDTNLVLPTIRNCGVERVYEIVEVEKYLTESK